MAFRETPLGPGAKKDGCFRRLTSQNLVISRRCFAEDAKEIYKELQHMCRTIVLLVKPFVERHCLCRRGLLKLSVVVSATY